MGGAFHYGPWPPWLPEGRSPSEVGSLSVSSRKRFLIFLDIRMSDWAEILTRFLYGYWLSCSERRAPTALRSVLEGPGRALPPGARPLPHGPLGHRLALILLPKNHIYSKKISVSFYPVWTPFIWIFCETKTCNKQEVALGTGSIC